MPNEKTLNTDHMNVENPKGWSSEIENEIIYKIGEQESNIDVGRE